MKKILIALLSLNIFLSTTACNSNTNKYKEINLDEQDPDYIVAIDHGITDPDNNIRKLIYDGKPITVKYYMDCYREAAEFGLVIFVNGIRQPYYFNNEKKETLMKTLSFERHERKDFSITFKPVMGKTGDILSVIFSTVLEPRFINTDITKPIFAYYHNYSQQTPWILMINRDIENSINPVYNKLNVEYKEPEEKVSFETNFTANNSEVYISPRNGKLFLDFDLYLPTEDLYCFLLFINHQLIPIDGCLYHEVFSKSNCYTKWSVEIDWNEDEDTFLYGLLIPINNEITMQDTIYRTESKLLTKRGR